MKGLIISSGTIKDYTKLKMKLIIQILYCVLMVIEHLIKLKVVPDLVLGDFDSISNLD